MSKKPGEKQFNFQKIVRDKIYFILVTFPYLTVLLHWFRQFSVFHLRSKKYKSADMILPWDKNSVFASQAMLQDTTMAIFHSKGKQ
jgi:hypothetical protein